MESAIKIVDAGGGPEYHVRFTKSRLQFYHCVKNDETIVFWFPSLFTRLRWKLYYLLHGVKSRIKDVN